MLIVMMAKLSLFEYFVNIIVPTRSEGLAFDTFTWLKRYLKHKANSTGEDPHYSPNEVEIL